LFKRDLSKLRRQKRRKRIKNRVIALRFKGTHEAFPEKGENADS